MNSFNELIGSRILGTKGIERIGSNGFLLTIADKDACGKRIQKLITPDREDLGNLRISEYSGKLEACDVITDITVKETEVYVEGALEFGISITIETNRNELNVKFSGEFSDVIEDIDLNSIEPEYYNSMVL